MKQRYRAAADWKNPLSFGAVSTQVITYNLDIHKVTGQVQVTLLCPDDAEKRTYRARYTHFSVHVLFGLGGLGVGHLLSWLQRGKVVGLGVLRRRL